MKKIFFVFVLIFNQSLILSQTDTEIIRNRLEKIDQILRIQDTRTPHDARLKEFLTDKDPLIRERATLAYGSIQDTSVLPLLVTNMSDENEDVGFAAVFAIGQTASMLSRKGRETLEHELIWIRLDRLQSKNKKAFDRMIEEIGKFGTDAALKDLMLRFGSDNSHQVNLPLVMSIARFAIRNIVREDATRYLVRLAKGTEAVPWQVVYALQRIGNNPEIKNEIDNLMVLYRHQEPLVRMHFATLLGKIKDEKSSVGPLLNLAEFDLDWRVRVNALKALANFSTLLNDNIVEAFRRSFFDKNEYVGLIALEYLGNTDARETEGSKTIVETFTDLRKISLNEENSYLWQYQATAANTLARLSGTTATDYIRVNAKQDNVLLSYMLKALGETSNKKVIPIVEEYLSNEQPMVVRFALEALDALTHKSQDDSLRVEQTYRAVIRALQSNDVALITSASEILTDSIFRKPESVVLLTDKLSRLRVPDDVEAMQSICATLGKLQDERAIEMLEEIIKTPDRSVAFAAADALQQITGKEYRKELPEWIQPLWTDYDFDYLHALPETLKVKMETNRGDVQMEWYKNRAPFTVMSFLKLATQKGYFRGLSFHRVVPNFVIQGGDPRGDGWGGPGFSIRSEFSPLSFETGMLGMASAGKDTEGSQFFIMQSPAPHLDGRYTIFGQVVSGMDVVNRMRVDDRILDIKLMNDD
ncbi:MAG: peptidylprolyl isomerase [Ignavibacteriae bacterium]|nr:peptidylprolyl isomerase [Ignavibacteriota bacterium]